jgi:uncharacterized SAM-binding protein YcdF (DUF218 family)
MRDGSTLLALLRFAATGLGLLFAVLFIGLIVFASHIERAPTPPPAADGIVVLTGGPARIDEALRLLAEKRARRLLISGVGPATTKQQLTALSDQDKALFACCVDLDRRAQNTVGNAEETRDWVSRNSFDSLIVVTANYHMPRALAELGRVLPATELVPYAVTDGNFRVDRWWLYPGTARLLLSEYMKYLPALARLWAENAKRRGGSQLDMPGSQRAEPGA